ncbi:chorismate mutase [Spirillospora sp. NPDC127200]
MNPWLIRVPACVPVLAHPAPAVAEVDGAMGLSLSAEAAFAPLLGASADRIVLADQVAAAKWGTGRPIEDLAREQALLCQVAERAARAGVDPAVAEEIFRDQIEAAKLVQRGLHRRWAAHSEQAPAHRPDLATEVRPALDRLTVRLLDAIRWMSRERAGPSCPARLAAARVRLNAERRLDALHARGLARALRSVC